MTSLISWVEMNGSRLGDRDFETMRMLSQLLEAAFVPAIDGLRSHFFQALRGDLTGAIEFFHATLPGWNYMLESNDGTPLCRINAPVARGGTYFASHAPVVKGDRGLASFAMILAALRAQMTRLKVDPVPTAPTAAQNTSTAAPAVEPGDASTDILFDGAESSEISVDVALFIPQDSSVAAPDDGIRSAQPLANSRPIVLQSPVPTRETHPGFQPGPLDELATIEHLMSERFPEHFSKRAERA